ncbi:DUF4280 domain-containing protein [Streptomyces sp. NPDC059627]
MGELVVAGAELKCSLGLGGPFPLIVPAAPALVGPLPIATVADCAPMANIPPLGLCTSTDNPLVKLAKVPVPCLPAVQQPWSPVSATVLIGGKAALTDSSKCRCQWKGVIEIVSPGQTGTEVAG